MAINPLQDASSRFFGSVQAYAKRAKNDRRAATVAALVLEREIKIELNHHGTGRWYGKHQASAPGHPPAPDNDILRTTIGHEVVEASNKIRIGSGQRYAPWLEFGTLGAGGYIAPRPFMRAAFARAKKVMTEEVADNLRRGRV